jgi:succinate dehydrogenase / fumarate reductase cytochrome b subunit
MTWLCRFLNSSIMKKQLMALTGLLLIGFCLSHLLGNVLIVVSADAFNIYAHTLTSNPLIYVAEAGLAALFLAHLAIAIRLTVENKKARGSAYEMKTNSGQGSTFASSTMIYTGAIILVFLVLHILQFKFGPVYMTQIDGVEMRDLHKTVMEYFQGHLNTLWYVVAMICLGIHLSHGFSSAFQSLGLNHKKYNCALKCGGKLLAGFLAAGFSFLAIWAHVKGMSV